jgi:hypothetical protein
VFERWYKIRPIPPEQDTKTTIKLLHQKHSVHQENPIGFPRPKRPIRLIKKSHVSPKENAPMHMLPKERKKMHN